MSATRRALSFALVPLSAVPLLAVAPRIAPSVQQRVHELTAVTASPSASSALPLRTLAPPPVWPRPSHPSSQRSHHKRRR